MPKIGVYWKDEDAKFYEVVFKRSVEQAGETVGGVLANAMRNYVIQQEEKNAGLKEITVFIGEQNSVYGNLGEHIKFIGRLIAREQDQRGNEKYGQALFQTRRNKLFLLEENIEDIAVISTFKIFDSVGDLKDVHLLPKITEALKEEEVGVRFMDI